MDVPLAEIQDSSTKNHDAFILGAGFSNFIAGMPCLKELSLNILKKLPTRVKDDLIHYFGFIPEDNFEMWLTYLSQNQPWQSEPENSRNKASFLEIGLKISEVVCEAQAIFDDHWENIIDQVNQKFQELRQAGSSYYNELMNDYITKLPKRKALIKLVQYWQQCNSKVITLNYDTLVERCWALMGHQNLALFGYPTRLESPEYQLQRAGSNWSSADAHLQKPFQLYKLHGSRNWFYSGSDSYFGETIFCEYVHRGNSGKQSELLQDKIPLIIPPVTEKIPHFRNEAVRNLWFQAGKALQKASRLFFLGYSLPETDLTMRFFLLANAKSAENNGGLKPKLYIINRNKAVAARYNSLLSGSYDMDDKYTGHDQVISEFVEALTISGIEESPLATKN